MKTLFLPLIVIVCCFAVGCGSQSPGAELTAEQQTALATLDSIHALSPDKWIKSAAHIPDSVYSSQKELNIDLTADEVNRIRAAARNGRLSEKWLFRFATNASQGEAAFFEVVAVNKMVDVRLHEFANPNQFAVEVYSLDWECDVYFFNHNRLVAKHHIFHKYGFEINSFIDPSNPDNAVVYYKQNFESGTGVWWWNYNFFRYGQDGLKPVLNTLQNGNVANAGDSRMFWYEATIVGQNPLKMKVVYNVRIAGPHEMEYTKIIEDSTLVTYNFKDDRLVPDFGKSGLTENKIVSYYLGSSDLLFVHAHYDEFKSMLTGHDKKKSGLIVKYLKRLKK